MAQRPTTPHGELRPASGNSGFFGKADEIAAKRDRLEEIIRTLDSRTKAEEGRGESLEQHLAELQAMPDFQHKDMMVDRTKWFIDRKKKFDAEMKQQEKTKG